MILLDSKKKLKAVFDDPNRKEITSLTREEKKEKLYWLNKKKMLCKDGSEYHFLGYTPSHYSVLLVFDKIHLPKIKGEIKMYSEKVKKMEEDLEEDKIDISTWSRRHTRYENKFENYYNQYGYRFGIGKQGGVFVKYNDKQIDGIRLLYFDAQLPTNENRLSSHYCEGFEIEAEYIKLGFNKLRIRNSRRFKIESGKMVFKNIYFPFDGLISGYDKGVEDFVIDCEEGIYVLNSCEYLDSNNNDSYYYGVIITKSSSKKTDPIKFMTRDHK